MKKIKGMSLQEWAADVRDRIRRKKDHMAVIIGYEGDGKSSLAFWLGVYFDKLFGEDRMLLDGLEFLEVAADPDVPFGSVINMDEGSSILFARDHGKKENKMVAKWVTVCRARRFVTLICHAELEGLDRIIRDQRAREMHYVEATGRVRVYRRPKRAPGDPPSSWRLVARWAFPEPWGPEWTQYDVRKNKHVFEYLQKEMKAWNAAKTA